MKELLPGIHVWSTFSDRIQLDLNGYHVVAGGEALLIDPPPVSDEQAAALERLGRPATIVVTNVHHLRAAPEVRKRFGARLLVPALDRQGIEASVDGAFADGDRVGPFTCRLLRDQKSPGETALHWPERRLLVLGDAVWGKPAGALSLLPDAKYADVAAARAGLRPLLELDVDAVLMGDGTPILSGGQQALRALLG